MIQCALRSKNEHIYAYSALGTDALFLYHDICGVALKLSDEIGLKKAAQQLGIQYYTLSDWRTKRNAAVKAKKYQMTDEELNQRNLELERENAELRKANDILKDALGFFAKDRKK